MGPRHSIHCAVSLSKRPIPLPELVKLDRLPNDTSLQGLLLIKDAWNEYDVAMLMASTYKFRSKLIFLLQLFLAWAMIALATFSDSLLLGFDV